VTLVKPLGAIHIPNVEMPWQAMREEKKAPPSPYIATAPSLAEGLELKSHLEQVMRNID
jgi:hypothetical protein